MKTASLLVLPVLLFLLLMNPSRGASDAAALAGPQRMERFNPVGFYYLNLDGRDGQVSR